MAEEVVVKKDPNKIEVPKRYLKTPKIYSKSTATPEQIENAKQEYIKCVTYAYTRYSKKLISEIKFKELLRIYKVDFDLSTRGKHYLKIIQLHRKGKMIKSTKLFDFGCFALYKEKTQKLSAHARDYAILKAKAKAIQYNAVYLWDHVEIDKQKNYLKEVKLQLKYDITQYQLDGASQEEIDKAKKTAKAKIAEIKQVIAQQKLNNKNFYEKLKVKREELAAEADREYEVIWANLTEELEKAKQVETTTILDKINKKENIRHIRTYLKEAKDTWLYDKFVAKNYHPAWMLDPEVKGIFDAINKNRIERFRIKNDFDDRIDNLKRQFIARLESRQTAPKWKTNLVIRFSFLKAWYRHAGQKIVNAITMGLIVFFAILGLFDSIPATSFLLTEAYIGSISVFVFIALIIFSLWVIFKIVDLVKRRAGIYDIVEAKYSKEDASSSGIGLASASPADEFAYLEELFNKEEKEALEDAEKQAAENQIPSNEKIARTVIREEAKEEKEIKAEEELKKAIEEQTAKQAESSKEETAKQEAKPTEEKPAEKPAEVQPKVEQPQEAKKEQPVEQTAIVEVNPPKEEPAKAEVKKEEQK